MSHEFRTPLNSILALTRFLLDGIGLSIADHCLNRRTICRVDLGKPDVAVAYYVFWQLPQEVLHGRADVFKMTVCPAVIRHRPEFALAVQKGKAVTEIGAKGKGAADEVRTLWTFLNEHAKRPTTLVSKPKRKTREAKR